MEHTVTDTQLLEKVRESNGEAFRALFERYQPILFRQVLFLTHQPDLAHDVVQETFVRVWVHRAGLNPRLSFLAYLFRISRNLVRDSVKHRKTTERLIGDVPLPTLSEGDDPAEALYLKALQERILIIVNRDLPQKCREIFFLSRFEGKTYQEIAEMLGLSARTVEHQIVHALKVLRKNLGR